MTITGWSWEYIDEYMTLPRLYGMMEYWQEHPPVHILMAAKLGLKSRRSRRKSSPKNEDMEKMISDFAGAGFTVNTIKAKEKDHA